MKGKFRLGAPALFHRLVQYGFLFFFLYVGMLFYRYFLWATGQTQTFTERPVAVEAFLPIGAFAGAKRLLLTGEFDPVHPAALVLLLVAICTALLFRKAVCGYFCPIGCVSGMLERLGKRLGISRQPGRVLSFILTLPKYVLLGGFVYLIWWGMNVNAIRGFVQTPYYQVADSRMLLLFLRPSTLFLVVVGILAVGSVVIPSFWCRGFCPYGALLGIFSLFSPAAVRRNQEQCTDCRLCSKACPSRIPVHAKKRISGPECVGCLECVGACPKKGCLELRLGYSAKAPAMPFWAVSVGAMAVLLLFFVWAVQTSNWRVPADPATILRYHRNITAMEHP